MVYRKTKATEERKEARRRLLLDAATRLFGRHGYHATTVPMIVAEAECSTGSFYMYFQNKEDVFNAALEELGEQIAELMQAVDHLQPDVLQRLSQGVEALFTFFARKPDQARILVVESSGLSPRLDRTRRAILLQQEDRLRRILESAPGLFAVENTTIAARCMVGAAFEALYRWLEENPKIRMSAQEVARAVADFANNSVRRASCN